jgi:hypothetical protein
MDDQRHAAAVTDEAVGDEMARDIARALAVDPSPEFLARVRTRIANEPPTLIAALKGCATFSTWRRASALRWPVAIAAVTLLLAVIVLNRPRAPIVGAPLVSRTTAFDATTLPYVAPGFSQPVARPSTSSGRAETGIARGEPVEPRARRVELQALLDPRETQALRSLLASVRNNSVDLTPLLTAPAPAPTELPPASDLVIAPIAIEPLAPIAGAQGERQ